MPKARVAISETTDPVDGLGEALDRLASWLRRAVVPTEWSSVALSTLDQLTRRGPQRITDLVRLERISQPGMTGLVGRLADAGLVSRGSDPTDGRATLVTVSPAGRAYLQELHDARARVFAAHIRRLPAPQQHALLGCTDALAALAALPLSPGAEPS